jgi:hypothetical protein
MGRPGEERAAAATGVDAKRWFATRLGVVASRTNSAAASMSKS